MDRGSGWLTPWPGPCYAHPCDCVARRWFARLGRSGRELSAVLEGKSDVLIVGAGPTGCAAGIVLARAGVDVCVTDGEHFPRDKTCGDALSNDAMLLIEQLGAREAVEGLPHAIVRRSAAVFPDGSRVDRDYDRPGYIVPRWHLDDCLRRALEAAGARLLQDCRVAALTREGERVTGAEGRSLRWSAKVVIAADGYGSIGLPALGLAGPSGPHLALAVTAYCRDVRFPHGAQTADHYFERELPYGYGWIFPAVDGVANVGVYQRADAYERGGRKLRDLMTEFVARRADRFAVGKMLGEPRAWSLPIAPRPTPVSAPGLLLAGDAGGFVDPLSGEGIWQGLHTGMLAGRTAAQAIERGELDAALRRAYEQACVRDIGRPSRAKALVQEGIAFVVEHELYRSRVLRAVLAAGYEHRALEMAKS
jgi:menaquinone-9 beta-reductase